MKNIYSYSIALFFILAGSTIFAQNIKNVKLPLTLYTNESGNFIYDTVVNIPDVTKDELYKRAKDWVISTVRTSDQTVVFDDAGFNEIRTDVTLGISLYAGVAKINFKLSIYVKENKCRFVCESFMFHYIGSRVYDSPFENAKFMDIRKVNKEFDKQFPVFTASFIKSVLKNKKIDW